jgi:hypothetical protein
MTEEVFTFRQCWSAALPPRFQVGHQNEIEQHFNWHLERIKQFAVEVSPVKRTMRILKDADEHDCLVIYDQRVIVTGEDDVLQDLKERWNVN